MFAMMVVAVLSQTDGGAALGHWVHLSAATFTLDDRPLARGADVLNVPALDEALRDAPGPVTIAVDRDASWRDLSRVLFSTLSVGAATSISLVFDPRRPLEAAAEVAGAPAVLTVAGAVTLDQGRPRSWPRGKPPAGLGKSLEKATLVLRADDGVAVGDVIAEWVALGCGACRATIALSSPRPALAAQTVFAKKPRSFTPTDVRRSDVATAINARTGKVSACYDDELKAHEGASGKLEAKFVIDGSGQLANLKVTGPFSEAMTACVTKALTDLQVGPGPQLEVTYPFNFNAAP